MTIICGFDEPTTEDEAKSVILDRACDAARIMHAKWPGDRVKQADYMLLTLYRAYVLVNLVKEEGRDDLRMFYVKGQGRSDSIPQDWFMAYIADEWTHTAWRLAYGDSEDDVFVRKCLVDKDKAAFHRLTQWLTPAGMAQRISLNGDYSEHPELAAVQHYHDIFMEHSDVEVCDRTVEVNF